MLKDMLCNCVSEGRRNALQDYQKTDGTRLVIVSPDSSYLTKSRKLSMARCAKSCNRNKRLLFTCRYVCSYSITLSGLQHKMLLVQCVSWWFVKLLNYAF